MGVTSLEKLKQIAQGEEITLPGWTDEPFVARVKRPSFLGLAEKGAIPNSLLGAAQKVFTQQVDGKVEFKDISKVMKIIAKESLIEPSYKQITEIGLELTDEQVTSIFYYAQLGMKGLESFRNEQKYTKGNKLIK